MNQRCDGIVDAAWHDCFWYNQGCEAYNGCETYLCENGSTSTGTTNGESFLQWLDCYKNTTSGAEECGDSTGEYYGCYMNEACSGIVDAAWHDCYWYGRGCDAWNGCETYACDEGRNNNTSSVDFYGWLDCYKNTSGSSEECGDSTGEYYGCYLYEYCDDVADKHWHDCYWSNSGCEYYNGCSDYYCSDEGSVDPGFGQGGFLEWLACYQETRGDCGDDSGAFYNCYMWESCEGIVNEYWHDCFWYDQGCDKYEGGHSGGDDHDDSHDYMPDDYSHDGQASPNFQDWIYCYEGSSYSDWYGCGESEDQRNAYYNCYWYGENCEDDFWFDCHWQEQDCTWM